MKRDLKHHPECTYIGEIDCHEECHHCEYGVGQEQRGHIRHINEAANALYQEVVDLKHQLVLTEKRALEWEQMHLDELQHRQRIEMNLADAHKAIREITTNNENPGMTLAKRMERLASEERDFNRRRAEEDERKRDEHNAAVRENVKLQSQIMAENVVLYRVNTELNKTHHDLVVRSVESNEKQTLLMENMSECLGNIVTELGVLSRRK